MATDPFTIYVDGPRQWFIETHNMDSIGQGRFSIHEHIGDTYAGAISTDVTLLKDARRIASQPLMEEALQECISHIEAVGSPDDIQEMVLTIARAALAAAAVPGPVDHLAGSATAATTPEED